MKQVDFLGECEAGRRDWRGIDLRGLDLFTPFLQDTHPELFSIKFSKLISDNNPVIYKPIDGINLVRASLTNVSFVDSYMLRARLDKADLKAIDARLTNLSGADFSGANLEDVDLRYSNLTGASFTNCKLNSTRLDHCNIRHANFDGAVFKGVSAKFSDFSFSSMKKIIVNNSSFNESCFYLSNLSNLSLEKSDFSGASLTNTIMQGSLIIDSTFSKVEGRNLDIRYSNISKSKFLKTNLQNANFNKSKLNNINFENSNLSYSVFDDSIMDEINFSHVKFYHTLFNEISLKRISISNTIFSNVNLTNFLAADINYFGQSSVDDSSVAITILDNSIHPHDLDPCQKLRKFLESCGMPPIVAMYMIDSIRTLQPEQLVSLMRSTFISYGTPNEKFAIKLNHDLKESGVTTFFYPNDAPFGEKLYSTMKRVDNYDRIILICSKKSLNRNGVQYELEKTLEREAKDGGQSYLIPITLDRYLFDEWKPKRKELREEVLNRVVADFSNDRNYVKQFQRLLQALRKGVDL